MEGREGNPERKRRAPCSVLNHKPSDQEDEWVKMKRGILDIVEMGVGGEAGGGSYELLSIF